MVIESGWLATDLAGADNHADNHVIGIENMELMKLLIMKGLQFWLW